MPVTAALNVSYLSDLVTPEVALFVKVAART
jgi:hypothetical protein